MRLLYDEARNRRLWGREARYAPLCVALYPVRYALLGHPVLERVAVTGRLIGDNDFRLESQGFGWRISARILVAGLMARSVELRGNGFRTALRELHALLAPEGDRAAATGLGVLDEG